MAKKTNNGKLQTGRLHGFALLEVFIALLVITIISSTMFLSGVTVNNYDKRKTTHTRIKYIQKVLNQYSVTYGRLPCPVDPTSTSASEATVSGVCSGSLMFNSSSTYYGAVPVDSLNISREYLQDGWGNKIIYVVPQALTYNNTSNRTILYYTKGTAGYQITGVSSAAASYITTDFANYLSTYYNNGVSDILVNNKNIYTLISSGENGLGAYTIAGTRNSTSGANATTGETANIITGSKANNYFYTNQSVNSVGKLDDIVYSTSISDIVSNNQSILFCNSAYTPNGIALPTPTAAPHYASGALVKFSDTCACPAASGSRDYVECLSGGNWGTVSSRACVC